jgi:lipopolysaccharide/colanic/teichoic acid biosynthesis glycosyltransferase
MIVRALDLVASAIGLLLASPFLLIAMLAIRVESAGSPIFTQLRVGRDGEQFKMYKLRTMVANAENIGDGLMLAEGDPRVTRVGRFLRRTSLDEVPNLINVLLGQMSLVGPRPTVQVQVAQYTSRQRRRLEVKPGITGYAQINGRASLPWPERIELDIWYIEHRSLRLDLAIIWKTVRLLVSGDGLYKGDRGGWKHPA